MSRANTLIGLVGGEMPAADSIELLDPQADVQQQKIRFALFDTLSGGLKLASDRDLALVIDSPGGSTMQYLCWTGVMTDPRIKTKTAYVANLAASAAAEIAGAADHIVCLPSTRFYFHYGFARSQTEEREVTNPAEAALKFHLTLESLMEFGRRHFHGENFEWLMEKVLDAFYTDRERGIADLQKMYARNIVADPSGTTDTSLYNYKGELTFTGAELAERGAVELVDSVAALQQRMKADTHPPQSVAGPAFAPVDDLLQMSGIVEVMRKTGEECFVVLYKDSYVFAYKRNPA